MAAQYDPARLLSPNGNNSWYSGTGYPTLSTDGTFAQGDIIFNKAPSATSNVFAWICITGGTPGTWLPLSIATNTQFGTSPQLIGHAQYSFANDGGAVGAITPANNVTLPANAVIVNVSIQSTTAVTSGGAATVAIGTSAGSSANSLLAATGKASFTAGAFVQGIPVPQTASTWVKLTAAGSITATVATAALTAGVIEIYVFYFVSST